MKVNAWPKIPSFVHTENTYPVTVDFTTQSSHINTFDAGFLSIPVREESFTFVTVLTTFPARSFVSISL